MSELPDYLVIDKKPNRTEFADKNLAENRFIHSQERKSRKLGVYNQPLFVNTFTVLRNKDMSEPGSKLPLLGLTSARVSISAASYEEALDAWDTLKRDVDQIFTEQQHVLRGLPLATDFNINA